MAFSNNPSDLFRVQAPNMANAGNVTALLGQQLKAGQNVGENMQQLGTSLGDYGVAKENQDFVSELQALQSSSTMVDDEAVSPQGFGYSTGTQTEQLFSDIPLKEQLSKKQALANKYSHLTEQNVEKAKGQGTYVSDGQGNMINNKNLDVFTASGQSKAEVLGYAKKAYANATPSQRNSIKLATTTDPNFSMIPVKIGENKKTGEPIYDPVNYKGTYNGQSFQTMAELDNLVSQRKATAGNKPFLMELIQREQPKVGQEATKELGLNSKESPRPKPKSTKPVTNGATSLTEEQRSNISDQVNTDYSQSVQSQKDVKAEQSYKQMEELYKKTKNPALKKAMDELALNTLIGPKQGPKARPTKDERMDNYSDKADALFGTSNDSMELRPQPTADDIIAQNDKRRKRQLKYKKGAEKLFGPMKVSKEDNNQKYADKQDKLLGEIPKPSPISLSVDEKKEFNKGSLEANKKRQLAARKKRQAKYKKGTMNKAVQQNDVAKSIKDKKTGKVVRNVRTNNPGNIKFDGTKWQGSNGTESGGNVASGEFITFDTPELGARALGRDLQSKINRGLNTVEKILKVYAPDGRENNTTAYINSVYKQTGWNKGKKLTLDDRLDLMKAITSHEGTPQSRKYFTDEVLENGLKMK